MQTGRFSHLLVERWGMDAKRVEEAQLKRHRLFVDWLRRALEYFARETLPVSEMVFHRGDVIWLDLGWNVGSELGGERPAIVLINSSAANKKVLVLPLTSQTPSNVFRHHVHVGHLPGLEADHWASVMEIRAVSKLRVLTGRATIAPGSILDSISNTIVTSIALRQPSGAS